MDYVELKKLIKNQKNEMTTSERMKLYNNGEEVDYLPFSLLSADFAMANIFGYTTTQYNKNIDVKLKIIESMYNEFGIDNLTIGFGLRTLGAAAGSKLYFPENGIDYVEDYIIKKYDDLEKIDDINPRKNKVFLSLIETIKIIKDKFPFINITTRAAGPISTAISMRPIELVLKDTRKNPEKLHKLLDYSTRDTLKWFELFKEEIGVASTSFSDPVTCMDVISKEQFDEFSLPYIKKLVDGIEKIMGKKPGAHICGKTSKIWEDLANIGLSSFSVDNCEDLEEIKKVVGNKMLIMGNVPPVEIMRYGTIDDVINSCIKCIKKGADSPKGFVLATGCQIPIGTPKENIEAFIYAARKYGSGAKKGQLPKGIEEIG